MGDGLEAARSFVKAVQQRDASAAVSVCAEDVEIVVPFVPAPFHGKDGVRDMIRLAPAELVQSLRGEEANGDEIRIKTLTRAPGIFANYTTWVFEMERDLVKRVTFEFRAAN